MSDFHLTSRLYGDDVKKEPTRAGFGRGLKAAGEKNEAGNGPACSHPPGSYTDKD